MRCTQPYGLPDHARAFLLEHAVRKNPCSHCGRYDGYESTVVGKSGMFDDLELHAYQLKDGGTATEVVQFQYDWSGPMIWLELDLSDGRKIQWTPEEVAEHLPEGSAELLRTGGWDAYYGRLPDV